MQVMMTVSKQSQDGTAELLMMGNEVARNM
jgi:hypothetical protein